MPIWTTPTLRHQYKCLKSLKRSYRKRPTSGKLKKLESAEASLTKETRSAKSRFESNLLRNSTSLSSSVFRYIRSIHQSSEIPSTVYLGSSTATSAADKASLFNRYFHSVFTNSSFDRSAMDNPISPLSDIDFNDSEVHRILCSLDTTKSMGIDGIGPSVLKNCADAIYEPLCHLFRCSIKQHMIPGEWKISKITPIHKSGDKACVSNYRPISLLCSTSKVLERLVYDQCVAYFNNIFSKHQFGFIKNCSTLQQLLVFYNEIFESSSAGS